jgi:transposase
MKDIQLYEKILGLEKPWSVREVRLDREAQEIEIEVACDETVWGCPACGRRAHRHGVEQRRWRHLDSCQYKTFIVCDVPRTHCPEHGTARVSVPWAEKHGRLTELFERFAIDLMLECSISAASDMLRVSWEEADGIKQRAVARGLRRKETQEYKTLCVDEKSFGRGHNYVTLVAQIHPDRAATVEYVGDGRSRESLDAFWATLTPEQLAGIEAVAMDMHKEYIRSTREALPEADEKITHDPFHLVRDVNDAVNDVRKQEQKALAKEGDTRLDGTRYLWLYGQENLPARWSTRFDEVKGANLKTARAWALKEMFRGFWDCDIRAGAEVYFQRWYNWAVRSRLDPIKKVAKRCKEHLANILTFFDHRITNGPIEGLNNKIQALVKKAFGYRNKERFKTDILFHLGGLDLYPSQ